MPRANTPCATPTCPNLTPHGTNKCTTCQRQSDQARGTATQRGYNTAGHKHFRKQVLKQQPLCELCGAVATAADHYPLSRKQLIDQGLNPNNPTRGRALCKHCHDTQTAKHQPGGWNQR